MKHFIFISAISSILGIAFYCMPWLDLGSSSFFFDPQSGFCNTSCQKNNGKYFMLAWDMLAAWWIPAMFVVGLFFATFFIYKKHKNFCYRNYKPILYLVSSIIVGPVIAVHSVKIGVGRARPDEIVEFKGEKKFTPAFIPSDECTQGSCSFVSRHAAAGFALFSLAFLIRRRRRRFWLMVFASLLGIFLGIGRIVAGRHYVSDVIFSGVLVYLTSYSTAWLFKLKSVTGDEE